MREKGRKRRKNWDNIGPERESDRFLDMKVNWALNAMQLKGSASDIVNTRYGCKEIGKRMNRESESEREREGEQRIHYSLFHFPFTRLF